MPSEPVKDDDPSNCPASRPARGGLGGRWWSGDLISVWLFTAVAVGIVLRFLYLDRESLWLDEGYQIRVAHMSVMDIIWHLSHFDNHPPLHFILLHYWMNLFGSSEAATRALSAVAGSLHLVVFAYLAKLMFNRQVALFSTMLLAVSEFEVYYSQEVRMYSLFALFATLSCLCFWRGLNDRRVGLSVLYIIASLLMLTTVITGLFVILTQGLFVVLCDWLDRRRDRLTTFLKQQAVLLLLFLPWLIVAIHQTREMSEKFQRPLVEFSELPRTYLNFADSSYVKLTLLVILIGVSLILALLSLRRTIDGSSWATVVLGAISDQRAIIFAALVLTVPVFAAFIVAYVGHTLYAIRANISACIGLLLLAGVCLDRIRSTRMQMVAISVLMLVSLENLDRNFFRHQHKTDFRAAIGHVENQATAGDVVLFNRGFNYVNVCSYYCKRTDLIYKPVPTDDIDIRGARAVTEADIAELRNLAATTSNDVWVFFYQSNSATMKLIRDAVSLSHPNVTHQSFFQVDVERFSHTSVAPRSSDSPS